MFPLSVIANHPDFSVGPMVMNALSQTTESISSTTLSFATLTTESASSSTLTPQSITYRE